MHTSPQTTHTLTVFTGAPPVQFISKVKISGVRQQEHRPCLKDVCPVHCVVPTPCGVVELHTPHCDLHQLWKDKFVYLRVHQGEGEPTGNKGVGREVVASDEDQVGQCQGIEWWHIEERHATANLLHMVEKVEVIFSEVITICWYWGKEHIDTTPDPPASTEGVPEVSQYSLHGAP